MKDSDKYQIRFSPNYESNLRALIKTHYKKNKSKKNKLISFIKLLEEFYDELEENPCDDKVARKEPLSEKIVNKEFELRKKRWRNLPGLDGSAAYGRLIYLVDLKAKLVHLLFIYTHKEYSSPNSRPSNKEIENKILIAKSD